TGSTTPSSPVCPTSSPWSSWPCSPEGSAPPRPSARPTKPGHPSDRAGQGPATGRVSGSDRPAEGVALGGVAGAVAGLEPLLALGRGAVGEAVRVHLALEPLLEGVVADGGGGVQAVGDVLLGDALDQGVAPVRAGLGGGVVGPQAGAAARLELQADRAALGAA